MEFIGEVIEVQTEGVVKRPARFRWRGHDYQITRILHSWHDYSMPTGFRHPKWTMRRHRNCYIVETDTHERFEIYFDRGKKRPDWVLLKHLGAVPVVH
ncbi:MAG TPA: DUF6504 family protein [Phycisphaerae bacterium]|nr:DUF6504 family protein [Phycisphaerae bacterium]HOJ73852.1 DUF6504 family protein [Phycisphaerae bacterium]HOM50793.1 DUF6504 family protein [Phycisphaerae bacterium]HON68113.1 DUF6504 family protein [Phycisphaerae bacterium]HPP26032.1 DUF6504 family protein [Phycisphaerae bacterium]